MNKPLIKRIIKAIEREGGAHFNMNHWFFVSDCGTTACIAGWAIHLSTKGKVNSAPRDGRTLDDEDCYTGFSVSAAECMGLTNIDWLFYRYAWPLYYKRLDMPTYKRAIELLTDILNSSVKLTREEWETFTKNSSPIYTTWSVL